LSLISVLAGSTEPAPNRVSSQWMSFFPIELAASGRSLLNLG
jgi:hypothetical protein